MNEQERRKFYTSKKWRDKRMEVIKESNYECVWCREEGKVTTDKHATLEVDHIYELEDYPKLALVNDNLRPLCKRHHNLRHNRFGFMKKKKDKWQDENW